jgi:hypothetical protein
MLKKALRDGKRVDTMITGGPKIERLVEIIVETWGIRCHFRKCN